MIRQPIAWTVLAGLLSAGAALAQPQPGRATQDPARAPAPDAAALKRADETFQQASRKCGQQAAQRKEDCLRAAREQQAKDIRAAGGPVPPAVQTQSSAVSATGVAPPAVDQRTPGTTPAVPDPATKR